MKKLAIILGFFCSLAVAENTASAPINKSTTNHDSQPKLIMVKGTSSNQINHTPPKTHTAHNNKHKSQKHTSKNKVTKSANHKGHPTKKVAQKSKSTKKNKNT